MHMCERTLDVVVSPGIPPYVVNRSLFQKSCKNRLRFVSPSTRLRIMRQQQREWLGPNPFKEQHKLPTNRKQLKHDAGDLESFEVEDVRVRKIRYASVQDAIGRFEHQFSRFYDSMNWTYPTDETWEMDVARSTRQMFRAMKDKPLSFWEKYQDRYMKLFADLVLKPERKRRTVVKGMQGDEVDIHALKMGRVDRAWSKSIRQIKNDVSGEITMVFDFILVNYEDCHNLHRTGAMIRTALESARKRGIKVRMLAYGVVSQCSGVYDTRTSTIAMVPVFEQDIARIFTGGFCRTIGLSMITDVENPKVSSVCGFPCNDENIKYGQGCKRTLNAALHELDRFADGAKVINVRVQPSDEHARQWLENFNREQLRG